MGEAVFPGLVGWGGVTDVQAFLVVVFTDEGGYLWGRLPVTQSVLDGTDHYLGGLILHLKCLTSEYVCLRGYACSMVRRLGDVLHYGVGFLDGFRDDGSEGRP